MNACLFCAAPLPASPTRPREFCSGRCRTAWHRLERRVLARHDVPRLVEMVHAALTVWRSAELDQVAIDHPELFVRMFELDGHPLIEGSQAGEPVTSETTLGGATPRHRLHATAAQGGEGNV